MPVYSDCDKFAPKAIIGGGLPSVANGALDIPDIIEPAKESIFHPVKAIDDVLNAIGNIGSLLSLLIKDNQRSRIPKDTPYMLSSTVPYVVDYQERKYVYAFALQNLTLLVGNTSLSLTAGQWLDISFPRGTLVYLDSSTPAMITIRCCDVEIAAPAGSVTVSNSPATIAESAVGAGAGNAVSCSLPGTPGKTTVIYGLLITAGGGLNNESGIATLSDGNWTLSFQYNQTNAGNGSDALSIPFPNGGLAAEAANTAITCSVPAITSGGTVAIAMWGTQK